MKPLSLAAVLLGSVAALAAPAEVGKRAFSEDITEYLKESFTTSKLNITYQTNAGDHGTSWSWKDLTFVGVTTSIVKVFFHEIFWQKGVEGDKFVDWKTFKSNGVNVGAWMEQEKTHSEAWWNALSPDTLDEWNLCLSLGDRCGPVLEERYSTLFTTEDIDKLAKVGVNALRVPTTYQAWVDVPGSALYHGQQQEKMMPVFKYAIEKYGMHIIIGLHSLPGGVNSLDIGEAFGHDGWFFNTTNLDYSFKAVKSILSFIKRSGHTNGFTIAPLNEASDTNLVGFGSCAGLTANGTNWITTYVKGVLAMVADVDSRIPVMLQDCFCGAAFWSPLFPEGTNLVFDSHVYYFAASGTYSQWVNPAICGQAAVLTSNSSFPVFVGEWSLQTMYNNTLDYRKTLFDTQRYAWQYYASGGAFWTYNSTAMDKVDGEGVTEDYWSYELLIDEGVVTAETNSSYC